CMFTSQPVLSQESLNMECGTTESVEPPADLEIPLVGRFKALVIYVQFLDDDYDNSCTRGWTEWPSGTPLPAAASYILSSSHTPPFPDSSLTAFFYEQSNENFTIYGDVVGCTTAYEECHYVRVNDICYDDDTGEWGRLDYGRVAEEAFDSLHARGSVDFSNYDENNDGYLDHAFIVLRHNNLNFLGTASGVSSLGFSASDDSTYGIKVHFGYSGSFNRYAPVAIDPLRYQISLLSHELFHDIEGKHSLFSDDHLMPIVGNNVPFESPPWDTTSSDPDLMKAYALLLGGDTGEQMGGQYHFMSASERAMVSLAVADQYPNQPSLLWINCPDLTDGATYNVK